MLGSGRRNTDPDLPGKAMRNVFHLVRYLVRRHPQAPRSRQEHFPRGGQTDAATDPLEQRGPERFLQAAYATRQGRLSQAELLCGPSEMTLFRDRLEVAEIPQVHLISHGYRSEEICK